MKYVLLGIWNGDLLTQVVFRTFSTVLTAVELLTHQKKSQQLVLLVQKLTLYECSHLAEHSIIWMISWAHVNTITIKFVQHYFKYLSKMPRLRNARSLVTIRELPSGLQIWGKRPLNALFLVGNNERWHRQRVWRERQSNSRTHRPWHAIRTFDVSNNGQPP